MSSQICAAASANVRLLPRRHARSLPEMPRSNASSSPTANSAKKPEKSRISQASQVQPLGYGASILFSTLHTDQLQLPARLSAYIAAFRALHPHRLQSVSAMLPSELPS
ncbi:TPA: hypothetical protein ACH3X2_001057 [Trebouxia sp. C0005]